MLKIVHQFHILFQLLGDFVPRPSTGAFPMDPTGGRKTPDSLARPTT